MEDIENKINQILSNPAAMANVLSIAKSLGLGGAPSEKDDSDAPGEPSAAEGFPQAAAGILAEAEQLNSSHAALLQALKPFIKPSRREKIDRAIKAVRISRIAGYAIRNLDQTQQGR